MLQETIEAREEEEVRSEYNLFWLVVILSKHLIECWDRSALIACEVGYELGIMEALKNICNLSKVKVILGSAALISVRAACVCIIFSK